MDTIVNTPKNKKDGFKKRAPKKITEKYLTNAGLAYLKRYTSSSMNFETVMMRKIKHSCRAHPEQSPDNCIALLKKVTTTFIERGYLDDAAYLNGMVLSLRRRGLSQRAIIMKLQQKGYKADIILEAIKEYDSENCENAELKAALKIARKKKIGPYLVNDPDPDMYNKHMAFLARRGFSFDIIKAVMDMKAEELQEFSL